MFPRASLAVVLVIACGGSEPHDTTLPEDTAPGCPSAAAPERCSELATVAAHDGNASLTWAYTVLECQSPAATHCTAMWRSYAKDAPTQTDALDVLHAACAHVTDACEQLAAWHTERGHALAAAAYHKRAEAERQGSNAQSAPAVNAAALATDLATVMHVGDAPRTDVIAQQIGHQLRAPVVTAVKPRAKAKPWPMHAAELGITADGCPAHASLDHRPATLTKCIAEAVLADDQIGIRNRCDTPVVVAYAPARGTANQFRLDRYQGRGIGVTHRDIGALSYAVCSDGCQVTSVEHTSWTAEDPLYSCAKSN